MAKLKLKIRKPKEADRALIMSAWLRGFKDSYNTGPIRDNLYWTVYKDEIEHILSKDDVTIQVACNSEDEDQILGFSVTESGHSVPVLHWIFVKPWARGKGIAKLLLSDIKGKFFFTFGVKNSSKLVSDSGTFSGGVFNPLPVKKEKKQ